MRVKESGKQKDYRLIWISNLWSIRNVGIIILLAQPLYKVPLLFLIPLSSPLCHSQPSPPQSFFSLSCSLLFHLSRSFPSLFSLSPHLPPLSFYLLSVTYPLSLICRHLSTPPSPNSLLSIQPSTALPPFPISSFLLPLQLSSAVLPLSLLNVWVVVPLCSRGHDKSFTTALPSIYASLSSQKNELCNVHVASGHHILSLCQPINPIVDLMFCRKNKFI